jgi:hypothetical protein
MNRKKPERMNRLITTGLLKRVGRDKMHPWHPYIEHLVCPLGFCTQCSSRVLVSRSLQVDSQVTLLSCWVMLHTRVTRGKEKHKSSGW